MKTIEDYNRMQRDFYESTAHLMDQDGNHRRHDRNPDYAGILLKPIWQNIEKWKGGVALDFACGQGRNVTNMLSRGVFSRADGVDISAKNIEYATKNLQKEIGDQYQWNFYVNNGVDCAVLPDDTYNFVMSTIALQHICVHAIRYAIMKDIYRSMKSDGIFSFQMGFGFVTLVPTADYYDNHYEAEGTNSKYDVRVTDPNFLKKDLEEIGFVDFSYDLSRPYEDHHPNWIYVKVRKP